jgi:DUF4097 and DUF4098 domain-containing protein YvlB
MQFRSFVLASALLVSGNLVAAVTEEETFTFKLNDGGRFSISNVNGSITVKGGGGDSVEILAIKKADNQEDLDEIEIVISDSASEIAVETELGESDGWWSHSSGSGQVTYKITVPSGTTLDSVETVNGDVNISGVSGKVVAESVNGDLEIANLAGDVRLATVNGSIEADFDRLEGQQSVKAETVNGRVTMILPEDADCEISADTLNGGINARDFGLEADKGFVGSDLNGKVGSGSARLNIDTVNGAIKIKKN